jgi:hypothetical protein
VRPLAPRVSTLHCRYCRHITDGNTLEPGSALVPAVEDQWTGPRPRASFTALDGGGHLLPSLMPHHPHNPSLGPVFTAAARRPRRPGRARPPLSPGGPRAVPWTRQCSAPLLPARRTVDWHRPPPRAPRSLLRALQHRTCTAWRCTALHGAPLTWPALHWWEDLSTACYGQGYAPHYFGRFLSGSKATIVVYTEATSEWNLIGLKPMA